MPVKAEIVKVSENWVSASLNSKNIFAITENAVITAIYAILWLPFFSIRAWESNTRFQAFLFCSDIIKTSHFGEVRKLFRDFYR